MIAATAFKDWAAICDAMGQGRQSLILRKGGLYEGRNGFQFKHPEFFLFPTGFHEEFEKLRPGMADGLCAAGGGRDGIVQIRDFVRLDWHTTVSDFAAAQALSPFHLYREAVVRERFDYAESPGLQVAFGRVYRLAQPWEIPLQPGFGGCRSWVQLPCSAPDVLSMAPALSDEQHVALAARLDAWLARFGLTASRFSANAPA